MSLRAVAKDGCWFSFPSASGRGQHIINELSDQQLDRVLGLDDLAILQFTRGVVGVSCSLLSCGIMKVVRTGCRR